QGQSAPNPAQPLGRYHKAVELAIGSAVDQHQVGLELPGIEAVVAKERLAERGLRGREPEGEAPVVLEDEAGKAGAEHAHAVEYDERLVIGERRHSGIAAVAVGRRLQQPAREAPSRHLRRRALSAPGGGGSDPPAPAPSSLPRPAPRGCPRTDRGGPWWRSRRRCRSGRWCA